MEKDLLSAEMPEVAEPVFEETAGETGEEATMTEGQENAAQEPLSAEGPEVAEPEKETEGETGGDVAPTGKTKADAAFAQMRRELAEKEKELRRLTGAARLLGFDGETPTQVADAAEAHYTGQSIEEIRQRRENAERQEAQTRAIVEELQRYRTEEVQRRMAQDLKAIQKVNPQIKSLDELGGEYFKLIQAGVSGEAAYRAIQAMEESGKAAPPPKIGKVNARTKGEKAYYTPEEVDRLTAEELDKPGVLERVMKSMTKWK